MGGNGNEQLRYIVSLGRRRCWGAWLLLVRYWEQLIIGEAACGKDDGSVAYL